MFNTKKFTKPQMKETSSSFYADQARRLLNWDKPFNNIFENDAVGQKWFSDGYLNACFNVIDRHASKTPNKVALIYSGDETKTYTYSECQLQIIKIANYLKSTRASCACIYMNMCAEAVFVVLACARLGIVHNVIFGGFNAESLAMRVKDSKGEIIFTINKTLRDNKTIDYYSNVVIASDIIAREGGQLREVVVFRERMVLMDCKCKVTLWNVLLEDPEIKSTLEEFLQCKAVPAENPLFYLYTSGSTGLPKGLIHTTGGYLTYAAYTTEYAFNVDSESVFCCTADLGWITGHTYSVYGPLLLGCTTIIFDGVPTSPKNRLFNLIEKWKVTHLYTSPTAIRMLRKVLSDNVDPCQLSGTNEISINGNLPIVLDESLPNVPNELLLKQYEISFDKMRLFNAPSFYRTNDGFHSHGSDLSSLRILGSVGEPINRDAFIWFRQTFGPYLPLIDTYWQTEAGGVMISPIPYKTYPIPECACVPVKGMDSIIMLNDEECLEGQLGMLFFSNAWPGIARTILNDNERFLKNYFIDGLYYTGDEALRKDGYIYIRGRADDVLKIAGHRLSTSEIESACCTSARVFEAAAISVPDEITGQAIVLFVCCKDDHGLQDIVRQTLRDRIGPVARVRSIFCVSEIPKTRTGKIMRRVLRNLVEGVVIGDLSTCCNKECVDDIRKLVEMGK